MSTLHRCFPSPATAPPLEDDDLLAEILLRLPPMPSSLPRASAVSKRWRGLASDSRFSRRFLAHHHRNPPLLGCFVKRFRNIFFQPALEAPNRVPQIRFSLLIDAGDHSTPLGCRHGLVLSFHSTRKQLLVWDPVIGDQHRLEIPPGFNTETNWISAAVLRTVGDAQHFQVVLVFTSNMQHTEAIASVYSSETSLWGNLITTKISSNIPMSYLPTLDFTTQPAAMAGDFLYWKLVGDFVGIIEFHLEKQCLAVTQAPWRVISGCSRHSWIIRTEGGGLCLLLLARFGFHAELWKSKTYCDGVFSWVLERTIDLDKLLSLHSQKEREPPVIVGFAEENNVVLLWTLIDVFSVQLESLQFKKLFECNRFYCCYPFEGVYITDTGICGGHGVTELLHSTSDDLSG